LQLLVLTRIQLRAALCHIYIHSLPRGKERTKKSDFGKPKSQVCLFAVANIAQARAQTLRAKAFPLGTPGTPPF
jgi:hypothetical protein